RRWCCRSPVALSEYLASCDRDATSGRPLGTRTGLPIRAVVPVHLYGQVADMDAIAALAERHGLIVVEDACQAHGAEYRSRDGVWRRAGSFGSAAAFGFYPGKNLGACGEGGAVTTDDEGVARTVRMLRDHGQAKKYFHDVEGYNGRLDAIQAAFLRVKLRRLDDWNAERRAAAERYTQLVSSIDITPPFEPDCSRAVYHLYLIRSTDRALLAERLRGAAIVTALHYPLPVHLQNCYRGWGYAPGSLPETELAAKQILSLPMFPGLTESAQRRVVAELSDALDTRDLTTG